VGPHGPRVQGWRSGPAYAPRNAAGLRLPSFSSPTITLGLGLPPTITLGPGLPT
jgi:hypothetical protein